MVSFCPVGNGMFRDLVDGLDRVPRKEDRGSRDCRGIWSRCSSHKSLTMMLLFPECMPGSVTLSNRSIVGQDRLSTLHSVELDV